jgi:endonuclease YncB( thermonuclease family)
MFEKLKSIYAQNKILGVICYILAFVIAFYAIFFVVGYYIIKLIWKIKMPVWAKVATLIIPLGFITPFAFAWTGATTGLIKSTSSSSQAILTTSLTSSSSLISESKSSSSVILTSSSQVSSTVQESSKQAYIKLEEGKALDNDGTKVEVVNEIKEVEKAINTVPAGEFVKVLEVVDGDTVKVEKYGTLRLIGIDTPETKDPRKVVQCFGKEATQNAKDKLLGQKVKLEFNPADRIDKYNRVLAYITTESGYDYNYNAILDGFANAYTKFPHPRSESYLEAQKSARENKRGLWSDQTCNGDTTQASGENTKTNVQIPLVLPIPVPLPAPKVQAPAFVAPVVPKPAETTPVAGTDKGNVLLVTSSKKCHTTASPQYGNIKYFTSYNTIEECQNAGGVLYK